MIWHLFHNLTKVLCYNFHAIVADVEFGVCRLSIGSIPQSGFSFRIWKRVLQDIQNKGQAGNLEYCFKKLKIEHPVPGNKRKEGPG